MKDLLQAKNFLILGFLNFLITNFVLQFSLIFWPVWISTLISQINNYFLGFFLYGKFVFKRKNLNKRKAFKYLIVSILAWIINTFLINLISSLTSYSESLSALIVIPIIVKYSFKKVSAVIFVINYFCKLLTINVL